MRLSTSIATRRQDRLAAAGIATASLLGMAVALANGMVFAGALLAASTLAGVILTARPLRREPIVEVRACRPSNP
jgi:hypothetical protein